ncbi:MAG: superoxide dismutase, Ni [Candidatus Promineifilaceae bacterium]|nr:superoxide dismutase, Ni [Candidatus Promineifilaceae bacterium]
MKITQMIKKVLPAQEMVEAHCDGPCGVYDPASARIAAEAVLSMTKKILALPVPEMGDTEGMIAYSNTLSRYIAIKEEQAHLAKTEVLVLWTDYFNPGHLDAYPDLHDIVWQTTKLLSKTKQNVDLDAANQLMDRMQQIHDIFWATKNRDVSYYTAS